MGCESGKSVFYRLGKEGSWEQETKSGKYQANGSKMQGHSLIMTWKERFSVQDLRGYIVNLDKLALIL